MKRAIIIFVIVFLATTLIPLISIFESNEQARNTNTQKDIVTIFQG